MVKRLKSLALTPLFVLALLFTWAPSSAWNERFHLRPKNLPVATPQVLPAQKCSDCDLTTTRAAGMLTAQATQLQELAPTPSPTGPVVRAVLFWMDGCPHCHEVLDHVLPPLQAKYGAQLQVHLIELAGAREVEALYALAASLGVSKEDVGVPFLLIGSHVLIGSGQIPLELPVLIERYLAQGGVDYPDYPALAPLLPEAAAPLAPELPAATVAAPGQATPAPPTAPASAPPTERAVSNGFAIAILSMGLMVVALVYCGVAFARQATAPAPVVPIPWMDRSLPALAIIGLGVAGYLAFVETQQVRAICGPIGDCNTVQSSPYARLFGVLPIGVLGVAGYLAILAAWLVKQIGRTPWNRWAALGIFAMAYGGVLFSLYLTYLEPFVIGAVCMWCVSSALVMTVLLFLSLNGALIAWNRLSGAQQC